MRFPMMDLEHAVLLGGPGFRGFEGGLMNPGAVPLDAGILMLGKANERHWLQSAEAAYAEANWRSYLKGVPMLLTLDGTLQLRSVTPVELGPDFPAERKAFEDFRMYRRDNRIWVHGVQAEIEILPDKITYWRAVQWHAELDADRHVLTGFAYPQLDVPLAGAEKNWCYFGRGADLFLLYSFSPFVLLRSTGGLRFETFIRRELPPSVGELGGFAARLSLGTNPMPYGEDHLFLMIHKFDMVGEERLYFHWAVLLDRETFLPRKISSVPLFVGGRARGLLPGIVYVMAAFEIQDEMFFSLCESDSHASCLKVPKRTLDELWTDFPSMTD
jgi:hypothetical protein